MSQKGFTPFPIKDLAVKPQTLVTKLFETHKASLIFKTYVNLIIIGKLFRIDKYHTKQPVK